MDAAMRPAELSVEVGSGGKPRRLDWLGVRTSKAKAQVVVTIYGPDGYFTLNLSPHTARQIRQLLGEGLAELGEAAD